MYMDYLECTCLKIFLLQNENIYKNYKIITELVQLHLFILYIPIYPVQLATLSQQKVGQINP